MIGQSLGSIYLSWEALCRFTPLYYFDTSGYAFTYPLARLFGCIVVCYTHYPTISLDMLSRVRGRSSMYNNNALIAKRSVSWVCIWTNYVLWWPTYLCSCDCCFLNLKLLFVDMSRGEKCSGYKFLNGTKKDNYKHNRSGFLLLEIVFVVSFVFFKDLSSLDKLL